MLDIEWHGLHGFQLAGYTIPLFEIVILGLSGVALYYLIQYVKHTRRLADTAAQNREEKHRPSIQLTLTSDVSKIRIDDQPLEGDFIGVLASNLSTRPVYVWPVISIRPLELASQKMRFEWHVATPSPPEQFFLQPYDSEVTLYKSGPEIIEQHPEYRSNQLNFWELRVELEVSRSASPKREDAYQYPNVLWWFLCLTARSPVFSIMGTRVRRSNEIWADSDSS